MHGLVQSLYYKLPTISQFKFNIKKIFLFKLVFSTTDTLKKMTKQQFY